MGLIVRENTEPIATGETASANELELEYTKVFNVLNGGLDDDNFASGSNIVTAKLADGSVPGSAFTNLTLTLTEIASATLTTDNLSPATAMQYYETHSGSGAMTSSSSFVDVDVAEWNVTPGSTDNFLFMTFTHVMGVVAAVTARYAFGFSVNGTDTSVLGAQDFTTGGTNTLRVIWAETAPVTTSMVVRPRYKLLSGSATNAQWSFLQFSAMLVPIKT